PAERFPSVLDLVAAVGGTSPGAGAGARAALFTLNPRRGPGSPVVIMDDEPEPHRGGRRLAAAAGLVLALGAGGVWLTLSSLPAPPKTVARPTPPPAGAERRLELGRLSVNAMPWGNVYIDGQLLGTVPLTDVPIWPGTHSLRVEREGFQPYERTFEITSGQRL